MEHFLGRIRGARESRKRLHPLALRFFEPPFHSIVSLAVHSRKLSVDSDDQEKVPTDEGTLQSGH